MSVIVGIDEVGRGCWAGPLVAAAVVLHRPMPGLKDSKLLTRQQRELLAKEIYNKAEVGLGWVEPSLIDEVGLTRATSLAMASALPQISTAYDEIIIDGHINFLGSENKKVRTLIKADRTIPSVSAASIVAKVARDNYMREAALQYPLYKFDQHVGYGTKLHLELLKLHGLCDLHRKSFKPIQLVLANQ